MKIGIVIHTNTGHTLEVARAVRTELEALGHEVDINGLRTIGTPSPSIAFIGAKFSIKSPPELDEYDVVIAGGPVWAFTASPVIMKYLNEDVQKLKGKKALPFVTMVLPLKCSKWGGADKALRLMDEELTASGADVLEGEKVRFPFFGKVSADAMDAAVKRICEKIGA